MHEQREELEERDALGVAVGAGPDLVVGAREPRARIAEELQQREVDHAMPYQGRRFDQAQANEFPRVPGRSGEKKLTTRALEELASDHLDYQIVPRKRGGE